MSMLASNPITIYPKCPTCKKPNEVYTFITTKWTCTQCEGCQAHYSWYMTMYNGMHVIYNVVLGFYDERDDAS